MHYTYLCHYINKLALAKCLFFWKNCFYDSEHSMGCIIFNVKTTVHFLNWNKEGRAAFEKHICFCFEEQNQKQETIKIIFENCNYIKILVQRNSFKFSFFVSNIRKDGWLHTAFFIAYLKGLKSKTERQRNVSQTWSAPKVPEWAMKRSIWIFLLHTQFSHIYHILLLLLNISLCNLLKTCLILCINVMLILL